jgi:hypothetical protein
VSSDLLGSLVVTHPFHPLTGQRLEVLFAKRRDDGVVFVCSGGFSGQVTLPEGWTDRSEPPLAGRLSAEVYRSNTRLVVDLHWRREAGRGDGLAGRVQLKIV